MTWVPKGSVRCAAASTPEFIRSPLAVFEPRLYQEAPPHWLDASASLAWMNADEVEATEVASDDDATPGGAVDVAEVELAPSAEEEAMHVEPEGGA